MHSFYSGPGCPKTHPMHFRFLCNLKKKCCWGEPNSHVSSLCKLLWSRRARVSLLIQFVSSRWLSAVGWNGILTVPQIPIGKSLLFYYFLKENVLMYVLKTRGLVCIFSTLNLDTVKRWYMGKAVNGNASGKNQLIFLLWKQERAYTMLLLHGKRDWEYYDTFLEDKANGTKWSLVKQN